MKTLKTLALATAVSAGLLGAGGAMAVVVDGDLATDQSIGKFDITLTTNTMIRVWGLDDVSEDVDSVSSLPTPLATDFCVYTNGTNNQFDLTVSTGKGFELYNDGNSGSLEYALEIGDAGATQKKANFNSETNITELFDAGASQPDPAQECSTGNMSMQVSFSQTGLNALPDGTYTDTVTITVQAK
ncbi:hypothetical protein [Endozoicomonas atrinae]|uniref:hypothetical protein n=1 Tax=Endozoicomonas atrinae TaxID=1333660 RepID=UPI000825F554|nr:hypothetical protein [Endozoicomonas atrinae]